MTVERETTGGAGDGTTATQPRGDLPVPPTVTLALRAALAQMVVMAVATAVTYFLQDALRDAWITARAASTQQTVAAVTESAVEPPAFFPVALSLFVTFVLLALVLVAMLRAGARWALYSMTVVVAVSALVQLVVGTAPGVPLVIMVLAAASVALHGLTLLLLWHPAHAGYFRSAHNGHWARVVDED
ncbi:hypothetical protein INN71_05705 [Nocardioides sp. ChNu-153]|uniref:hypothetical protein n=1 Tax=unclassified Nocardioides TaxID=2615069 RepID=UPI0024067898|nr:MULTISPECIES: hypothetical protein [unclassified Nocardioides]MDF9717802.1 hypothetical protein [Nocardioides sp. ChNu-99]MDN7120880.1 hypothetical protein [Nocardioides sp. ChNu-153]